MLPSCVVHSLLLMVSLNVFLLNSAAAGTAYHPPSSVLCLSVCVSHPDQRFFYYYFISQRIKARPCGVETQSLLRFSPSFPSNSPSTPTPTTPAPPPPPSGQTRPHPEMDGLLASLCLLREHAHTITYSTVCLCAWVCLSFVFQDEWHSARAFKYMPDSVPV